MTLPSISSLPSVRLLGLLGFAVIAAGCPQSPHEPVGAQTFTSPQADPIALSANGDRLYVANTTSNSVTVIATATRKILAEIPVGLEPVSVAVRPAAAQVWVSNHVSDSVSVIDVADGSPTQYTVVQTIQSALETPTESEDPSRTGFDEPVGIAFDATGSKAYVALSSRNDIAVIDASDYSVMKKIHITAQEPRALAAAGNLLYVPAFESGNRTELSVCPEETEVSDPDCTLLAKQVGDFVIEPNLPGAIKHIVVEDDAPDRDLFVIDMTTDAVIGSTSTIGTLLYDVAVGSSGNVFVSLTDARNDVSGLEGDDLDTLENRAFDNEIGVLDCDGDGSCDVLAPHGLDPALPDQPNDGTALAMPYGLALSGDETTLVGTAASTSRLFTMDADDGTILDIFDLGSGADAGMQIPKGIALASDESGAPETAYVLNTLENTVSFLDVSDPSDVSEIAKIPVGNDPTPDSVRRGHIAFTSAFASTSHTFSCESCHPDGNTDQLLWTIGGACFFSGPNGDCSEHDEIRSTMPIRGLDRTVPLHWDGTLGDPFGGPNGSVGPAEEDFVDASCDGDDPQTCFRDLVNASLSGVMCSQGDGAPGNQPPCQAGPTTALGALTETERDDMATFLWAVKYPPARERAIDDALSDAAVAGMSIFFLNQTDPDGNFFEQRGGVAAPGGIMTCSDMDSGCHALPLLNGTNNATLQGFDAPTLRGMNDRWLQFSIGITGAVEALEAAKLAGELIPFTGLNLVTPENPRPYSFDEGFEEDVAFAASFAAFSDIYNVPDDGPVDLFQMFQEMSTGFSGALGRQVALNADTTSGAARAGTSDRLAELEAADEKGGVNLRVQGRHVGFEAPVLYSWRAETGLYTTAAGAALTRDELLNRAAIGSIVATATAALPENYGVHPQPLLAPECDSVGISSNQISPMLPLLDAPGLTMRLRGWDVLEGSKILVNGQVVEGTLALVEGAPDCVAPGPGVTDPFIVVPEAPLVDITLDALPADGLHSLQVQSPAGPYSNELPICVSSVAEPSLADCL